MKTIKYIGFYDTFTHMEEKRNTFLAATNKMDYISKTIVNSGYMVNIISPSWTENMEGFYRGRTEKISHNVSLILGSTFGAKRKMKRPFRIMWSWLWLFLYLCFHTQKNEKVLVYHSMMLITPVLWAKRLRRFHMILEVEEIYQDVTKFSKNMSKKEYIMFNKADGYLFSTELLNNKLNLYKKPYSVIYGTYEVNAVIRNNRFDDDKIHVVYAGTFDPTKGGILAITTAQYLPQNYHIHIIGFGSESEIKNVQETIENISNRSEATITYDGLLKGEEYILFLQKCDIGLSTQMLETSYNNTSFPSKILSYMANGLRVVSVRIKAIELSAIGNAVYYYEEQSPKAIAEAILSIDMEESYNSRTLINKLDRQFIKNVIELLEN